MSKFRAVIHREIELEIEAESIQLAEKFTHTIMEQLQPCKLHAIYPWDYVEPDDDEAPPRPPFGRPNGGGTPGTPVVKQEILVDQVAKVA